VQRKDRPVPFCRSDGKLQDAHTARGYRRTCVSAVLELGIEISDAFTLRRMRRSARIMRTAP